MHVTPRVWEAAHLFFKEGSDEATAFVRERLKRILEGEVSGVVRGWRAMGTRRHLGATKRKRLANSHIWLAIGTLSTYVSLSRMREIAATHSARTL